MTKTIILKALGWTLFFWFVMMALSGLVVAGWGYSFWKTFSTTAGVSWTDLKSILKEADQTPPTQTNYRVNVLVLGTDSLPTRPDSQPLTDTIIIASLNLNSGKVSLLSLPRDLWLPDYQTRVNALYFYGREKNPDNPSKFPTEVISETTGVPIHHTLVVSLDDVAQIIDLAGGVKVQIAEGFTDEAFPRTDVDVTQVHDPKLLYETVSFQTGEELMSGERALKFIRSRHANGDQGTDNARSARQQAVISALISQLTQAEVFSNPELLGQLYKYYLNTFESSLPLTQALAIAKRLYPVKDTIAISSSSLGIFPEDQAGVLIHPPVWQTQNQWVYTIKDPVLFQTNVKERLDL